MGHIWLNLQQAINVISRGDFALGSLLRVTLQTSVVAATAAAVIGLPLGLVIGLGRFRGRALLHTLANASLGFPPVLVGLILFVVCDPPGPLRWLNLNSSHLLRTLYVAQAILALPYVVALSAAAVQGLPPELLVQARLLGAGRFQTAALAVREARVGIVAALIAGLAATLAEVGAIAVLTGLWPTTLVGGAMFAADNADTADALACAMVLMALTLVLLVTLGLLQHRSALRLRRRVRAPVSFAGARP